MAGGIREDIDVKGTDVSRNVSFSSQGSRLLTFHCAAFSDPIIASVFGPDVLVGTLFSNTSAHALPLVSRDEVSPRYSSKGKFSFWCLTFTL
jgi:hypothetical protein